MRSLKGHVLSCLNESFATIVKQNQHNHEGTNHM